MQDDLLDQVVDEFFTAIETKDKTLLKDALSALITFIQDEDKQSDEEMEQ